MQPALPNFVLARRKRSSSALRRLKHSNANFVSEQTISKGTIPPTRKGCTCKFTLENLRFGSSALTFVRFEKILCGVLKDMIWKQAIYNISNILEWCVNVREQDGDMVGGQVSSNPGYPD